jgi:DNA-binding MarR family transcriptional regulator
MHSYSVLSAWTLRVAQSLEDALPGGLSSRDVAVLTLVASHDDVGADWLRARVGLTQSGTVRAIERLVDAGLVVRSGRRGHHVLVSATDDGRETLTAWQERKTTTMDALLSRLLPGDRDQLLALVARALEGETRERVDADTLCRTCDWSACTPCPVDRSVGP